MQSPPKPEKIEDYKTKAEANERHYVEAAKVDPSVNEKMQSYIKSELAQLPRVLSVNSLDPKLATSELLDKTVYLKLLQITTEASKVEQSLNAVEEKMEVARLNAVKLTLLFGNVEDAVAYLIRAEKQLIAAEQLVHDACLFNLPNETNWNIPAWNIWRDIVKSNSPSSPSDMVMRLLSYAFKIESYIQQNKPALENEIRENAAHEIELEFSRQYDALSSSPESKDNFVQAYLKKKEAPRLREIKNVYENKIRKSLGVPESGQLNEEQRKKLKDRSALLPPEKDPLFKSIGEEITHNYVHEALSEYANYTEAQAKANNKNKQEWIAERMKRVAGDLNTTVKLRVQQLFNVKTPPYVLYSYAKQFCYKRAKENLAAAVLFFDNFMPEKTFNLYLALQWRDDPALIPPAMIEGSVLHADYSSYYISKIHPSDPRMAMMGVYTSCCQSLGQAGKTSAIHSITNPKGGCYALQKKLGVAPHPSDVIYAQCWAWRDSQGRMVFDSVESQVDFRRRHPDMISAFFKALSWQLVNTWGVSCVLIGKGGNTPINLGVVRPLESAEIEENSIYSDAAVQLILADRRFPFLERLNGDEETVQTPTNLAELNLQSAYDWCDLHAWDKRASLSLLTPYLTTLGITQAMLNQRVELAERWMLTIATKSLTLDEIIQFFAAGINIRLGRQILGADGKQIIHFAAEAGQLETVQWLVKHGADSNVSPGFGWDAFYLLLRSDKVPITIDLMDWFIQKGERHLSDVLFLVWNKLGLEGVQWLIARGADINTKQQFSMQRMRSAPEVESDSLLHKAVQANNLPAVEWLVMNGIKIDSKDSAEDTPLLLAAKNGHWDIVRVLLKHGADIKYKNKHTGNSILHFCLPAGDAIIIKECILAGADVNATNRYGQTLLHHAARLSLPTLRLLLQRGADPTLIDTLDKSVLHYSGNLSVEAMRLLIHAGADVDSPNSPVLAEGSKLSLDCMKVLVEHGADVNAKSKIGGRPVLQNYPWDFDKFSYLVNQGADFKMTDSYGMTMLHLVCEGDDLSIFKWLLDHGADVNARRGKCHLGGERKYAVLWDALEQRQWEKVKLLVEYGADLTLHTPDGESLLDYLKQFPLCDPALLAYIDAMSAVPATQKRISFLLFQPSAVETKVTPDDPNAKQPASKP